MVLKSQYMVRGIMLVEQKIKLILQKHMAVLMLVVVCIKITHVAGLHAVGTCIGEIKKYICI